MQREIQLNTTLKKVLKVNNSQQHHVQQEISVIRNLFTLPSDVDHQIDGTEKQTQNNNGTGID